MQQQINPFQLKKFMKHLCIVSKRYYDRENSKKNLDSHLDKLKKKGLHAEIGKLNSRIDDLLEKEVNVSQLGRDKRMPVSVMKKLRRLEKELDELKSERAGLREENKELKKAVQSMTGLREAIETVHRKKDSVKNKVHKLGNTVEEEHKRKQVEELRDKIVGLEESYNRLKKDRSIHPARLHKIEEKLNQYKKKLKRL
ncbi:hypothetical protein GF323_05865 [Candidatus Woesearchaeota archaeon]|nr:hypothetical protein [Candidatus Woesearchaeota archaeon]